MSNSISLLILLFAIIHVAEEYFFGWLSWVAQFAKGITLPQFIFWNAAFLLLCLFGVFASSPIFKLSLASLLLCNVLVHLVPTVFRRQYSPGLVSAILLYLPLGFFSYFSAVRHTLATTNQVLASIPLGALWMSIPFLYQLVRTYRLSA